MVKLILASSIRNNPLRAHWPTKGFHSVIESLTPSGQDTNPSQISSLQTLVLIYLPRKDGAKENQTNVQISSEPGIEPRTLWLEGILILLSASTRNYAGLEQL